MTIDIQAIKARRAAITPGEWLPTTDLRLGQMWEALACGPSSFAKDANQAMLQAEADADFIAAAPADIDALLAEVERLNSALYDDAATKLGDAILEAGRLRAEVERLTAELEAAQRQAAREKARREYDSVDAYNQRINDAVRNMQNNPNRNR